MVYLSSFVLSIILFFIDCSLVPHFLSWVVLPIFFLPFLSLVSQKDRSVNPIILAAFMGILTDSVSGGGTYIYTASFLTVALLSKVFLTKFASYGEIRASIISTLVGILVIYIGNFLFQVSVIQSWQSLVTILGSVFVLFLSFFAMLWLGGRYFSWLEKETEERFRR